MNKKTLLTLSLILISFITCYSQSNEALGDKAMSSGNYDKAVEYFMAAINQNPTDALSEKLNKATLLKNEFKSIDEAISARNADELETHITNVLTIDPNNRFVEAKRRQLSSNVSQYKSDRRNKTITGFFIGDNDKVDVYGFGSLDLGVGLLTTPNMIGIEDVTLTQRFQMKFLFSLPIVLDFQTQRGLGIDHAIWGLGAGSCFFVGNHITLDYGIGLQRNKMAFNHFQKEKGYYYRAGITLVGNHGYGLNYVFNHFINPDKTSFNCHQITLLVSMGNKKGSNMGIAAAVAIWQGISMIKVFKTMKN